MKKYFMAESGEELNFGDMIELDFVGEEDGVKKHSHVEMKFIPEVVDDLLEEEIITVKEVKDRNYPESLEDRVTDLEEVIAELLAKKEDK